MFIMRYVAHTQKIHNLMAFNTMSWITKFAYRELTGVCLKQGGQPCVGRFPYNPLLDFSEYLA